MKSVFDFIVKPIGKRYNNTIQIGDIELVLNTKVESYKFVNNFAEVVATPLAYKTPIKKGDIIVIHHNVFRRWYNIRGEQKDSRSFFKDDLYFVSQDQIYLYSNGNAFKSFGDRCFVSPTKNKNVLDNKKEQSLVGILKIGNSSLEALEINPGDIVGYKPFSEYDFVINDERLYCMKSNDIVIKYGHEENQAEYNPSWAKSS